MRRGDIVIAAPPKDKSRPAVIVQSDRLPATDTVLLALITSDLKDAPIYRLMLEPSPTNGLKSTSQVMVDKIVAMPRGKCGQVIGRLKEADLVALNHMLSLIIGLADSG